MRPSPLRLICARGLLLGQPRVFSLARRSKGPARKRLTFLIQISRPGALLRFLPPPGQALSKTRSRPVARPAPAA